MKNGKYTQEEIDRTIEFFHILGIRICFFSLLLIFGLCGFEIATHEGSMPTEPDLVFSFGIGTILFILGIVILLIHTPEPILVYHNKKIDKREKEKAKQDAEKLRTQSQIWVNE
jgi:hypothetical protein